MSTCELHIVSHVWTLVFKSEYNSDRFHWEAKRLLHLWASNRQIINIINTFCLNACASKHTIIWMEIVISQDVRPSMINTLLSLHDAALICSRVEQWCNFDVTICRWCTGRLTLTHVCATETRREQGEVYERIRSPGTFRQCLKITSCATQKYAYMWFYERVRETARINPSRHVCGTVSHTVPSKLLTSLQK